jgi:VanZ family protein
VLKNTLLSLAIGWTFLILVLCLAKSSDLPSLKVNGADKYGHFSFHFGFTLLWALYVRCKLGQIPWKSLVFIVLISWGYGIIIEFLQETFTKTRHADIMDVMANFIGASSAFFSLALLKMSKRF